MVYMVYVVYAMTKQRRCEVCDRLWRDHSRIEVQTCCTEVMKRLEIGVK